MSFVSCSGDDAVFSFRLQKCTLFRYLPNLFSVCQEFIVTLHFLLAGLLMPDDGDSNLNINTFMGLGDGPRGCGKVIENNKKHNERTHYH